MTFPAPEVGLVISYSYLWSNEAEAGGVEGRKDRPCAVVLVVEQHEGKPPVVAVVPVTHTAHHDANSAMEIPAAVKRHLGLDAERSWIVLDELNVFTWPGFDLRTVPGHQDQYHYGLLPPKMFEALIQKLIELRRRGSINSISRDDPPTK